MEIKKREKTGGRKKGVKNKKTIEQEKALALYKREMLKELEPLIRSQQQMAKGLSVMLRRKLVKKGNKLVREGELEQVKKPDEVERLLNSEGRGEDWYFITTKDPNIKALQDIFDRIWGKAPQAVDVTSGGKPVGVDLNIDLKKLTYEELQALVGKEART